MLRIEVEMDIGLLELVLCKLNLNEVLGHMSTYMIQVTYCVWKWTRIFYYD